MKSPRWLKRLGSSLLIGGQAIASASKGNVNKNDLIEQLMEAGPASFVIVLITGISAGTSLSGSTDNTVCTVTGANAIQGESNVRIDSGGRVLIGATTEGAATADELTIETAGSTGMTIRSGTSSFGSLFFSDGTSGNDELAVLLSIITMVIICSSEQEHRKNSASHQVVM